MSPINRSRSAGAPAQGSAPSAVRVSAPASRLEELRGKGSQTVETLTRINAEIAALKRQSAARRGDLDFSHIRARIETATSDGGDFWDAFAESQEVSGDVGLLRLITEASHQLGLAWEAVGGRPSPAPDGDPTSGAERPSNTALSAFRLSRAVIADALDAHAWTSGEAPAGATRRSPRALSVRANVLRQAKGRGVTGLAADRAVHLAQSVAKSGIAAVQGVSEQDLVQAWQSRVGSGFSADEASASKGVLRPDQIEQVESARAPNAVVAEARVGVDQLVRERLPSMQSLRGPHVLSEDVRAIARRCLMASDEDVQALVAYAGTSIEVHVAELRVRAGDLDFFEALAHHGSRAPTISYDDVSIPPDLEEDYYEAHDDLNLEAAADICITKHRADEILDEYMQIGEPADEARDELRQKFYVDAMAINFREGRCGLRDAHEKFYDE